MYTVFIYIFTVCYLCTHISTYSCGNTFNFNTHFDNTDPVGSLKTTKSDGVTNKKDLTTNTGMQSQPDVSFGDLKSSISSETSTEFLTAIPDLPLPYVFGTRGEKTDILTTWFPWFHTYRELDDLGLKEVSKKVQLRQTSGLPDHPIVFFSYMPVHIQFFAVYIHLVKFHRGLKHDRFTRKASVLEVKSLYFRGI